MKKNGFTLIELLAVIVVLAIIVLLAVTAAVPMMNRAKKSSLADEALAYIRAAKQAYTVENMDGQTSACYDVSYLNEKYIMKEDNNYKGMVIVSGPINDINFSISLSNGKFYVVKNNASKVTISDVVNSKPSGYAASCGSYNPVLSNEVNTNSLVYKLIMANGKSTLEANLNDISTRSASVDFSNLADTAAESGLFTAADDDGASYYYRGIIDNNWVSFAGFYWRIIRVNGDGSIRMIYTGTSSNHSGYGTNTSGGSYGDLTNYTTTTRDVTGLTTANITTTYSNGRFAHTHVGYMYNPVKVISAFPTYELSNTYKLTSFPLFSSINDSNQYYIFKNFNPETDCFTGNGNDETGTCTLKCAKLGEDCILTNWGTHALNTSNYSTTATGVSGSYYVYTNLYKYTCWDYGTPVTRNNSNSTTSVYVSCPMVSEVVGVVNNQPTNARIRYRGLFSADMDTARQNIVNSKMKNDIDTWYQTNIYNKKDASNKYYEEYIADEIFCNDRSYEGLNNQYPYINSSSFLYGSYPRVKTDFSPSFKCPDKANDGFTLTNVSATSIVTPKNNGNNMLKYPVGLITADEVVYAGGGVGSTLANTSYWLRTNTNYWTMTPSFVHAYSGNASVWAMATNGSLSSNYTSGNAGVRPVINLSSSVLFNSGNGTESSPYTVKLQ